MNWSVLRDRLPQAPWILAALTALALALIAFLVIEISGFRALGPKGYLKTIVMVPAGMTGFGAVAMAIIMTPVELIGKIVKPFALCLRLFANMTAGHFVILSLLGLIFLFANWFIAAANANGAAAPVANLAAAILPVIAP